MEYGLIGEHLSDSFTKFIHERIASYFSNKCSDYKDYKYEVHELRAEQVKEYLHASRFKGINVAAPYQQTVIPYLDEISDQAREIGAVDTIINRGGRLCGYNTAYFARPVRSELWTRSSTGAEGCADIIQRILPWLICCSTAGLILRERRS